MKKKEFIKEIKKMTKNYPNDAELGNKLRTFLLSLKSKKENAFQQKIF